MTKVFLIFDPLTYLFPMTWLLYMYHHDLVIARRNILGTFHGNWTAIVVSKWQWSVYIYEGRHIAHSRQRLINSSLNQILPTWAINVIYLTISQCKHELSLFGPLLGKQLIKITQILSSFLNNNKLQRAKITCYLTLTFLILISNFKSKFSHSDIPVVGSHTNQLRTYINLAREIKKIKFKKYMYINLVFNTFYINKKNTCCTFIKILHKSLVLYSFIFCFHHLICDDLFHNFYSSFNTCMWWFNVPYYHETTVVAQLVECSLYM